MADQYRRFPEWAPMMLDENLQDGVHYAERRKLRAVTQPLLAQFRRILARGAAQGLFSANVEVDKFYAPAFSLVTACFLTRSDLSVYMDVELRIATGTGEWERL